MSPKPLCTLAPKLPPAVLYGGDYNPEQWPEAVWLEDARLMREAGVNLVSVAIFSWTKLEPKPGHYNWEWLDRVIDVLWGHGVSVCLATATASPPAWLVRAHPEMLPVDASGVRLSPGSRQHYCPNSRAYRAAAAQLSRKIAERFANHPAVALWHINNEIGCHIHACYCDVCAADFRQWLQARYKSLEALNEAWHTTFWSQIYGDWDEIFPPRKMPTFCNPTQALDYQRFMSDSLRDVLLNEVQAVRSVDPQAKVTTNAVTLNKPTDYWEFYRHVDVAAWDAYPDPAAGLGEVCATAFSHDLFRSLRAGQPFILMEQVTSQVNWRPNNTLKAPGQMRALSYQALSRGADGIMFFQWRASKAGAEKYHGSMIPHYGPDGRVFAEVKQLGNELKKLSPVLGAGTLSRVAVLKSWENRWALELDSKPRLFDYTSLLVAFYRPFWEQNVAVDILHPDADLSAYDVVIAPVLYQLKQSQADSLRNFTQRGGTLLLTFFSGVTDEREHAGLGGYPAMLRDVLGLVVEEWQPLAAGCTQRIQSADRSLSFQGREFTERVHLHGAEALAVYHDGDFAGLPAVTRHRFGKGRAYYVSTLPEPSYLLTLCRDIAASHGLRAPVSASPGVEVCIRRGADREFLFVINQTSSSARADFTGWAGDDLLTGAHLTGAVTLEPYSVRILSRPHP